VPEHATVLEPGCGIGNFMAYAPQGMRFIGVELDSVSGRIARALHPAHDIRIEHFRETRLPEGRIDAVIGNVPFADIKLEYAGTRLSLHDFFLAKSLDALKPGGVLALVTSHYTLDRQHGGLREHLADHADFLGAIRLPAEAFKQEGTKVVTDILCLRKRAAGELVNHVDPTWLATEPLAIEGVDIPLNQYFLRHAEMVPAPDPPDRLYGRRLATARSPTATWLQLQDAVSRLPEGCLRAKTPELSTPRKRQTLGPAAPSNAILLRAASTTMKTIPCAGRGCAGHAWGQAPTRRQCRTDGKRPPSSPATTPAASSSPRTSWPV
jgi:SAM-dependent methyltransferase